MKRDRYEYLLSVLLDEDLCEGDAAELLAGLREHPELQRDLRQQLILWDVWSQRVAEERSAEAFVEAWKTRVHAEAGSDQFSRSVLDRIGAPLAAFRYRVPFWKRWRPLQIGFAICALTLLAAAGWWAHQQFSEPETPPPHPLVLPKPGTGQTVTIAGEGVCVWCVLREGPPQRPAIRVKQDGVTRIVYLEFRGYSTALHHYFTGGTTVTATGVLREENSRLILTVRRVEVNGHELR
jgi:hypothetical protein